MRLSEKKLRVYLIGLQMSVDDFDLLAVKRGAITAPAGCGKTHLIADALLRHVCSKPILVLTHTNAGVVALRERLKKANVPASRYRLSTIDGWAIRLIKTFPSRSAHDPSLVLLSRPSSDYPNIRDAASNLLSSGHVSDVLESSYFQLVVDEYQDCSIRQHSVISQASEVLPTCVLGDPMQAIFGFGADQLASWDDRVCSQFPIIHELDKPWRWVNAGADQLGDWLLQVRLMLAEGNPVDIRTAPEGVTWVQLDGAAGDHVKQLQAARTRPPAPDDRVLIIGDSRRPDSQRTIASQTPGAVTVEAVDLKDLVEFSLNFNVDDPNALSNLIDFAQSVMRNVGATKFVHRIASLSRGTARKEATEAEQAGLDFLRSPTVQLAVEVLVEIGKQAGVTAYRPAVLRACLNALQLCSVGGLTFNEACIQMREQNRATGRSLPKRAVGSTLLLKGLEAEAVVILAADALDARNLYVAMTRGSKQITVCSTSPILGPNV